MGLEGHTRAAGAAVGIEGHKRAAGAAVGIACSRRLRHEALKTRRRRVCETCEHSQRLRHEALKTRRAGAAKS